MWVSYSGYANFSSQITTTKPSQNLPYLCKLSDSKKSDSVSRLTLKRGFPINTLKKLKIKHWTKKQTSRLFQAKPERKQSPFSGTLHWGPPLPKLQFCLNFRVCPTKFLQIYALSCRDRRLPALSIKQICDLNVQNEGGQRLFEQS